MYNSLKIVKSLPNSFLYYPNGGVIAFAISKGYFSYNGDLQEFQIVEQGQAKRPSVLISNITVQDLTTGGTIETGFTISTLQDRLVALGCPLSVNIVGGGGGGALTLQEVLTNGNETTLNAFFKQNPNVYVQIGQDENGNLGIFFYDKTVSAEPLTLLTRSALVLNDVNGLTGQLTTFLDRTNSVSGFQYQYLGTDNTHGLTNALNFQNDLDSNVDIDSNWTLPLKVGNNVVAALSDIPEAGVPYTGATQSVDLGGNDLSTVKITANSTNDYPIYLGALTNDEIGIFDSSNNSIIASFNIVTNIYRYANGTFVANLTDGTYKLNDEEIATELFVNNAIATTATIGSITTSGLSFSTLSEAHAWLVTFTSATITDESYANGVYKFTVPPNSDFSNANSFCANSNISFVDVYGLVTVFNKNAFRANTGNNVLGDCNFDDNAFLNANPTIRNTINRIVSCGGTFASGYTGEIDVNFFGNDGTQTLPTDIFTTNNIAVVNTLYFNKFNNSGAIDGDVQQIITNLSVNADSAVSFGVAKDIPDVTIYQLISNLQQDLNGSNDNYPSSTAVKLFIDSLQSQINLNELLSNKENTTLTTSAVTYPTTRLVKSVVDTKVDKGVSNATTIALTTANLNSSYPTAKTGFEVYCGSIIAGKVIYKKTDEPNVWLGWTVLIP